MILRAAMRIIIIMRLGCGGECTDMYVHVYMSVVDTYTVCSEVMAVYSV